MVLHLALRIWKNLSKGYEGTDYSSSIACKSLFLYRFNFPRQGLERYPARSTIQAFGGSGSSRFLTGSRSEEFKRKARPLD